MKKHHEEKCRNEKRKYINPIYGIYINSLALGGRKGMISMLSNACRYLGWSKSAELYPWQNIRYQSLQIVRSRMLEDGYAISSVNLTLAGMRSIAKAAFNMEKISGEQFMRIKSVTSVKGERIRRGRSLTGREIRKVIVQKPKSASVKIRNATQIRDRAIFMLFCYSGLRSAELLGLMASHLDVKSGRVLVLNAKGRKQREVYVHEVARKAIRSWLAFLGTKDGPLFRRITSGGEVLDEGLSASSLRRIFQRIQKTHGIGKFSPHDLRRTFITHLLEKGEDINTVKKLVGHSSISTTASYDCRDEKSAVLASKNLEF